MSKKLMGLGRGLDSLISMDNIQTSGSSAINEIELSQISPNPEQPRAWFDEESLEELALRYASLESYSRSRCANSEQTNIR